MKKEWAKLAFFRLVFLATWWMWVSFWSPPPSDINIWLITFVHLMAARLSVVWRFLDLLAENSLNRENEVDEIGVCEPGNQNNELKDSEWLWRAEEDRFILFPNERDVKSDPNPELSRTFCSLHPVRNLFRTAVILCWRDSELCYRAASH